MTPSEKALLEGGWTKHEPGWWTHPVIGAIVEETRGWFLRPIDGVKVGPYASLSRLVYDIYSPAPPPSVPW